MPRDTRVLAASTPHLRERRVTAALLLAASGVGLAATSSGGVIRACASKHGGALRLITPGRRALAGRCSKRERAVIWNQGGPAPPLASGKTFGQRKSRHHRRRAHHRDRPTTITAHTAAE
jgi:hypothetical protein